METTKYRRYEDVRLLLEKSLTALADAIVPDGVTRIGLRYIDEIRVPSNDDSGIPRWDEWVDGSLLGPHDIEIGQGLLPVRNEGASAFSGGDSTRLVLRYGAQDTYVVGSTPQLRRPLPARAGCSSWTSTAIGSQRIFRHSPRPGFLRWQTNCMVRCAPYSKD